MKLNIQNTLNYIIANQSLIEKEKKINPYVNEYVDPTVTLPNENILEHIRNNIESNNSWKTKINESGWTISRTLF